jgi:hypothetical protein
MDAAADSRQWLRSLVLLPTARQIKWAISQVHFSHTSSLTDRPCAHQALAFAELSKVDGDGRPLYQQLIADSIQVAHWLFGKQTDATLEQLAVELMVSPSAAS